MQRVAGGAMFRAAESQSILVRQVQREANSAHFGVDEGAEVDEPPPPAPEASLSVPRLREAADIATLPYVEPVPNSIEGIICSFDWPQGCAYWAGLAMCESNLQATSTGYGGRYVGLFQVWLGHGYSVDWLLDPYNNTLAAYELSDGGKNTAPWPYCR